MKKLFSERHGLARPRTAETLDTGTIEALIMLIRSRVDEEWFGLSFPSNCPDGRGNAGTDLDKLQAMMKGYHLISPLDRFDPDQPPSDSQVFDLLEFSYECVAEPEAGDFHSYFAHSHYSYNQDAGREKFAHDVNRIFERNGLAFELQHGEVVRLAPAVLHEALARATFRTGDQALDGLLELAREKFLNRSPQVRQESLEKLWDAWERLKTLEPGKDKKQTTKILLDKATSEENFRARLEKEASELTEIGNKFMIRHTETDKVPIGNTAQVDYLFHRMFALIRLLLKQSGRGG
ncbi:hypothetical protein QF000_008042 [Paraburkholderia atlantica]|uniref:AbiJ-NTD4 domain-containing protein n=1 Tax=Paraburkholderia atlantica TaxID=2654982 RepID=UPI003D1AF6F1